VHSFRFNYPEIVRTIVRTATTRRKGRRRVTRVGGERAHGSALGLSCVVTLSIMCVTSTVLVVGGVSRSLSLVSIQLNSTTNDLQRRGGAKGRRGGQKEVEGLGENRTDRNHTGEARHATDSTTRKQKPRQEQSSEGNLRRQRRKINVIKFHYVLTSSTA